MILNLSGIIYINLNEKEVFRVIFVDLINTKVIHIKNSNEFFKLNKDKPSLVYKNIPFYVLVNNFSHYLIPNKKVKESIKFYLQMFELKNMNKNLFKKILKNKKL